MWRVHRFGAASLAVGHRRAGSTADAIRRRANWQRRASGRDKARDKARRQRAHGRTVRRTGAAALARPRRACPARLSRRGQVDVAGPRRPPCRRRPAEARGRVLPLAGPARSSRTGASRYTERSLAQGSATAYYAGRGLCGREFAETGSRSTTTATIPVSGALALLTARRRSVSREHRRSRRHWPRGRPACRSSGQDSTPDPVRRVDSSCVATRRASRPSTLASRLLGLTRDPSRRPNTAA